jgi:polysaccharide chain length determinant protein (PEP-CTERM system associated)
MKELKNLHPTDYLKIILRRKWYFLITTILVIAGVSVVVWRLPSYYRSEAKVGVESPFVSETIVTPVVRSSASDRINSIREQISSRTFLERIVEQFQIGGFGARSDFVMENAVRTLRKKIGIDLTSENTFTISFVSGDPQSAQNINKRLVDELIRSNTSYKDKTFATDKFIEEQLRQASQTLSEQEEKIKQFKLAHLGELPEQYEVNMNTLNGLYAQLSTTENALQQEKDRKKLLEYRIQERKEINLLEQTVSKTNDSKEKVQKPGPSKLEAELAEKKAAMKAITDRYTEKHPLFQSLTKQIQELEQQLKETEGTVGSTASAENQGNAVDANASRTDPKAALQTEHESAAFDFEMDSIKKQIQKREKDREEILRQIAEYQKRLKLAPALERDMSALLREEDVLKQQYLNLQNKKFNTQMAATVESDKKNETYKIIDEPNLPAYPEIPNRWQLILIGIGVGILLGLAAAFGREMLDSTIGSEEEAVNVLNLPVLVSIMDVAGDGVSPRKVSDSGMVKSRRHKDQDSGAGLIN